MPEWASSYLDIYGNTIKNNGLGKPDNGVAVPDSGRGGIIMVQQKRGTGRYGEYLSKNIKVHDNTIVMAAGANGATSVQANRNVFGQNNKFLNNHYEVPDQRGLWWVWQDGPCTWRQWPGYGHDATSTVK